MPHFKWLRIILIAVTATMLASSTVCRAQSSYDNKPRLESLLPESWQQNLEVNAWGWFSYLHDSMPKNRDYWEAQLALGGTWRINDNLAATANMQFIADNDVTEGVLQQAFVTWNAIPTAGTLLTVGKFNADIGVEGRNEWDRFNGTTSLIFGAIPQDLIGAEITQPIGETGVSIRPFIANSFNGQLNSDGGPVGGAVVDYQPVHGLTMSLTNLLGPGFIIGPYIYTGYPYNNWIGTNIDYFGTTGALYLADGHVSWQPITGLTLQAEGVIALQGPHAEYLAWSGFLFLANYDITDQLRVFARYSYLNDKLWLVTGITQITDEISGGAAFEFFPGAELRGEYRHDDSNKTGNVDSVSVHLVFSY
jgi:hypothetical protein